LDLGSRDGRIQIRSLAVCVGEMNQAERKAVFAGVVDIVPDDRIGQLVKNIEKRLRHAFGEGDVAGTHRALIILVAGGQCLSNDQPGYFLIPKRAVVDGEDANHVIAEVWHEEVVSCGIDNGLMRTGLHLNFTLWFVLNFVFRWL